MESTRVSRESPSAAATQQKKIKRTIDYLENDILCIIFSYLGLFDLVRCSLVCKSWNWTINKSKLLEILCYKLHGDSFGLSTPSSSSSSQEPFSVRLEKFAMKHHVSCLQQGRVEVHQWRGHSVGVSQCRLKRGLLLTGVGDQVLRLWSVGSYKCVGEFPIPSRSTLVDFDFDESKIVGLFGAQSQICIWRHNASKSIFPSREGTFSRGSCIRYFDPEAVVGCDDGAVRVFDMYGRKCSRIIRMHSVPITCLSLGDEQLIFGGSSSGSVGISDLFSNEQIATLRLNERTGIRTLCYNPSSRQVFAGTTAGYASCWDLRTMKSLWEQRIGPNVIYSLHLRNDRSTLVAGGIDGLLRIVDQNTGEVISCCVMDGDLPARSSANPHEIIERKKGVRLPAYSNIDKIPRTARPQITCLAVGMKKVVTTHNGKYIRMWKFNK